MQELDTKNQNSESNESMSYQTDDRRIKLLRISIGIIYLWFGTLKFFPHLSPAESLAKDTIDMITFGLIPGEISILILAIGECTIGLLLLFNFWKRLTLIIALSHMVCTFLPLILLPNYSYIESPFSLTLVGQYIMKNLVIITALFVIYPNEINWIKFKKLLPV